MDRSNFGEPTGSAENDKDTAAANGFSASSSIDESGDTLQPNAVANGKSNRKWYREPTHRQVVDWFKKSSWNFPVVCFI